MANTCKPKNRLPASFKLRLGEAGITYQQIAEARRARGHSCSSQYVTRVINQIDACPESLRALIEDLLTTKAAAHDQ